MHSSMSTTVFSVLLPHFNHPPSLPTAHVSSPSIPGLRVRVSVKLPFPRTLARCNSKEPPMPPSSTAEYPSAVDCVGTGSDVECYAVDVAAFDEADQLLPPTANKTLLSFEVDRGGEREDFGAGLVGKALSWTLLVSPFFFWGTAMVAMKEVIPKTGPFFVSAFRLIPAGLILIGFAASRGRKLPAGTMAWLSIFLFGVVDGAFFQGFLAEGLQKTSAGLGSVRLENHIVVSLLLTLFRSTWMPLAVILIFKLVQPGYHAKLSGI